MKHEVLFTAASGDIAVLTLWTYDAAAVTTTRIAAERSVIATWLNASPNGWKTRSDPTWVSSMIKSWDFSVTPPVKRPDFPVVVTPTNRRSVTAMPPFVAIPIACRTEAVGASTRGINGRVFHLGVPDVDADPLNGKSSSAARVALLLVYGKLRADFIADADSGVWSIVSFFVDGTRTVKVPRVVPLVLPIDHFLIREGLGVQRRRRVRQQSFALGT